MHLTFRTRLTLWHAICVAAIFGIAAIAAESMMAHLVRDQLDQALISLAHHEIAAIEQAPNAPLHIHEAAPGTAWPSFERLDRFVQIVRLDGVPVARSVTLGTAQLPLSKTASERLRHGKPMFQTVERFMDAEPIRLVSLPVDVGGARYAVQVAGSLDDARALVNAARWLFLGIASAILFAVVVTGSILTRRALRPIDGIVTQARHIGERSLAARLPHPGHHDEIGRLVETLNDMLTRLEQSFEFQRHFTADASHELMSPLSRLRTELEITLRRSRNPAEYEAALRSCLEEVERLCALTEELLGLARLDATDGRDVPTGPVGLTPILEQVVRRLERATYHRNVTVVLEPESDVAANASPGVVTVALANVLDNAVKFCNVGGHVTVRVATDADEAIVSVSDTGPGVRPEEMHLIFERFHRGSAPRATGTPGVGLGLAICREVLEREGGRISVTSEPGRGATFTLRFPRAGQPALGAAGDHRAP